MNPALRLISTFDGRVKVYIDDSKFAGLTGASALTGCDAASIKSVSLFVKQSGKPFSFWSNTLNGPECTYSDDQGALRIVSEVAIATALPSPASYDATLTLNYGSSTKSVTGSFKVVGDMITPEIKEIRQSGSAGTALKLKISPNSYEGLNELVTSDLSKVIIVKDGVMLTEVAYAADGVYDITGLTANTEYSFAAIMKSSEGYLSEISVTVKGTPSQTPDAFASSPTESGLSGDYFINTTQVTRPALGSSATDAERKVDYLSQLDVYAYEHAADDLLETAVPESLYRKIGTVKAIINDDKTSTLPVTQFRVEGAFNGRLVRHFVRASNGYGQGASATGTPFRVMGAVSAPAVSCSLLSDNKYEIAVQPGAAVVGYTLIGHKVEVKARSATTWGTSVGTFSDLTADSKDTWSIAGATAHLKAIEKVTSSGVTGKSDVVSSKAVSKLNFQLTAIGAFDVRVRSIYELTRELTQVALGAVVLGSDLRLTDSDRYLKYGLANTIFADATLGKTILADNTSSVHTLVENVIPLAAISSATWTPAHSAAFVSASGDSATYTMSMAKFPLGGLTEENGDPYTYDTYSVKYSIMKKGLYPQYAEIASLDGALFDQAPVKKQFAIPRGEKSEVGVQVSVYKLGKMVAQSGISSLVALTPSGQGAYSGLAVMTHADQSALNYPAANVDGADVKSVLNHAATTFAGANTVDNNCKAFIALESTANALDDAHMNYPAFLAADWDKSTKIYLLDEEGKEIMTNLAGVVAAATFNELNKPNRAFDVHTLTGLKAMKSHSYTVHRDWVKLISGSVANNNAVYETLLDTEPITFTVIPTVAVAKRDVTFIAGDGAVNCSFKLSALAELNGVDQKKAIQAQGGVFNAVLVKNADDKYAELDQSSSAHFTSPVANGARILSSRAQYLNPNFGAEYSIDMRWVMSAQTTDVSKTFGPGPAQLNASVESVKLTQAIKDVANTNDAVGEHGCLFTFDEPAALHRVTIRAVFDDASYADADSHADLATGLTGAKKFMTHTNIMGALSAASANYYGQGVTFLIVHKDTVTGAESLPKALFHMPKGLTTFAAGDFDVKSGAKQLTIMYNKTEDAKIVDHAGHYEIPATITYKEVSTGHIQTLRVADLTSANGIVISGLDDARSYRLTVAIDGQSDLDLQTNSPAASPNAVANLKVTPDNVLATKLNVKFEASKDNGEYSTVSYKAYVSTLKDGVTRYLSAATGGSFAAPSAGKFGFAVTTTDSSLTGLTTGAEYNVEIESTFAATGSNSAQVVSAYATGIIPSIHPEIKDFRLDTKNSQARLVVDINGGILNTLILLANNGSLLNIDLKDAQVAQTVALSKGQNLALNIDLKKYPGITNVAVIVANSRGPAMAAANAAQGSVAIVSSASDYNDVVVWTNL
jgi:hypothetical protein